MRYAPTRHSIERLEAFRRHIDPEGAGVMTVDLAAALVTTAARYTSSTFSLA